MSLLLIYTHFCNIIIFEVIDVIFSQKFVVNVDGTISMEIRKASISDHGNYTDLWIHAKIFMFAQQN